MPYLAYKLTNESKKMLMEKFPPRYPQVKYDHITIKMCDSKEKVPQKPDSVQVIGIANDNNGLEVFLVQVNHSFIRSNDQLFWHITASLDSSKLAPSEFDYKNSESERKEKPYQSVTSNGFLLQLFDSKGVLRPIKNKSWKVHFFEKPIDIQVIPRLQFSSHELISSHQRK